MRRAAIYGGSTLVLAAAGWSALWFTGRGELAERLDLERERLLAQGIEVEHQPPLIGGFPFGYEVELREIALSDRASGLTAQLPVVTATTDLGDVERVLYRLPPTFFVELPGADAAEGADPVRVEFETEEMVVEQRFAEARPAAMAVRAKSALAVHAAEGQALNAAIELGQIDATLDLPMAAQGAETALRLAVGSVDYLVTGETETGAPTRLEGGAQRLGLTATTDQRTPAAVLAVLAGAPGGGRLAATLQAEGTRIEGAVGAADIPQSGRLSLSSGATGGVFRIEGGQLSLSSSSENNRLELVPGDPSIRLQGAAVIDRIETVYRSPLMPAEAMDELALRIAMGKITPDAGLWRAIDPEEALVRAPGEVILDLLGTARMLADEETGLPMGAELGNLTLRSADLSLLGASAELRGDLEFLQPANRPVGRLTLTLTRSMELVGELVRAGLLDISAAQLATAIAANYTQPGATPQTLVSDLEFRDGTIWVNGEEGWSFGPPAP
ncbi:DUF2125 domain-containing protein [Limibaculum sp. M0105]|uniref:DUF2125 domain-containing protein n=1 Tax=Thermohalobaculum xanthum TaxID=2753746 RepID=A0A8J7M8Q9_9RHOB|nr:DUF2125 domain-containing protein [Thermohalobaculum xanthum]MBK0399840.1 DUF2125 domain-containing protein [Thermohalobaculum xanthum]